MNKSSSESLNQTQVLVASINRAFGYSFNDVDLLVQALTHRSAEKSHNERLEFLGDAILGLVVAEWLYAHFPNVPEGKLTRMRSSLVKGETLADIAKQKSLGDYLRLGSGELKSGGYRRASILADVVEAILGAIYLDGGLNACRQVILEMLAPRLLKLDPNEHPKDNKTRLQEYLQGRQLPLPQYEVIGITGKDHDQTFTVECQVSVLSRPIQGIGASRRKAEQAAAQKTLEIINQETASDS